jgi:hypothetical protein
MGNFIKPNYLCITSGLFSIILIIYFFSINKNIEKNTLAFFLFLCLLFSQLFWYNPIKGSFIHKMDAKVAKMNAVLFVLYTLFYKNLSGVVLFLYLLLGVLTIYAFCRSDYYSTKEWCCDLHLFNHGLIHIASFFALLIVFI